MSSLTDISAAKIDTRRRATQLFAEMREEVSRNTDRMFAGLMIFQCLAGIVAALLISPRTWAGADSSVHIHVWAAILIGGANTLLPVSLVLLVPGKATTRHVIAICQMLTSCLLVDLTGGRIETHFHYFGSLAFLAFYRDWRVLATASIVAGIEHLLGGLCFPRAMFGVVGVEPWRWLEHVGWVAFEDFFLIISITQSLRQMRHMAASRADLEMVNATIEQEVETRTAELRQAREDALAASLAKSEFLSSMSHEIRTPMNAILGMAELLDETPLEADQKRYLEVMRLNGDALLMLINGILDLARVESGRMSLEHVDFDLEEVVGNAVETLAVRAHEKGLELVSRFMPGVPLKLVGDQLRIRQVLINLVGNAIKFTGSGQVLVTVEKDPATDGTLHFSVADTGIGMTKETLARIFSNFTQADSSTTRKYGGSGLGLAIVKQLTHLMGGKVWVESEVGRGSVFHLVIPLAVQGSPQVEKPTPASITLAGTRVLIVDDNPTNRLILHEMLSGYGAQVTEAEDGPGALAAIQSAARDGNPYKLMLLDCRMPGMDGFQVAREVRAMFNDGLTVMMLSSEDLSMTLARVKQAGLDAYLMKPVRRGALFQAIGSAMSKRSGAALTESAQPASVAQSPIADKPPVHILVTDDSSDNRLLVQAYLKNTQAIIDEAENGAIAVEMASRKTYDLILMDIQMPVMDGFEAIRRIRQGEKDAARERTRIFALTASALESDVRRCLEVGADKHLSKPIKKRVLLAAINPPAVEPASAAA